MGGAFSLISRASLTRFAEAGEIDRSIARRFRMLIEIDGVRGARGGSVGGPPAARR